MAINDGDILSALNDIRTDTSKISQTISNMSEKDLHQIQQDLSTLVRISQGTRRTTENDRFQRERDERARRRYEDSRYKYRTGQGTFKSSFSRGRSSSFDGVVDEFISNFGKGIEDELKKSLADSPISRQLKGYIKKFADDLGIQVSDIPSALGQSLGKYVLKNTQIGKRFTSTLQKFQDELLGSVIGGAKKVGSEFAKRTGKGQSYRDVYSDFVDFFGGKSKAAKAASTGASKASNVVSDIGKEATTSIIPKLGETALAGSEGTSMLAGGEALSAGAAIPEVAVALIAIQLVSSALDELGKAFGPAIEGINKFTEEADKVKNRYFASQKQMIKTEQERIKADVETMAKLPFDIMTEAAQKWYDAWDSDLRKIGQTQGYTKADVQTLFGNIAERLRAEGLGDVISAADISANLGQVLEAGLSGKVAEEFAYQATLLGSAIPTHDFFSYADTYGQIVGNAISKGMSKDAAIQEATRQMQQHASNLLYASRNISDGIASALKDSSSLFAEAVKIAQTARTGESSQISAVLTAAAAEVSAIAPDLASGLISNIVQAAVGGNNSDLVALRSMAGIGASNTAFLQALATDPQQVFAAMFSNLARMQNLDKNNYMEVAESLSQTFGISASAFARIDFAALAQAISSMKVNSAALSENVKLLKSGETTPSLEAMRYQQINQMILDEGLTYVLDSEAGRAIQQHMWDQELANEIMEREYSVDFAGSAKEMIQGILETIHNIVKFLNPFSYANDLVNLIATGAEYGAQKADIISILEKGKVGTGNALSFYNLTNYNGSSIQSVPPLMYMMGLASSYGNIHSNLSAFNASRLGTIPTGDYSGLIDAANVAASTARQSNVKSKYSWGFVGKSLARAIAATPTSSSLGAMMPAASTSDAIRKREADTMNQLLGSMGQAIAEDKSYEQWRKAATEKYKISDFGAALTAVGLSEAEARGQFEAQQAQKASEYNHTRDEIIKTYCTTTFPNFAAVQLERMQTQIDLQTAIRDELQLFHSSWATDWLQDAWTADWVNTRWAVDWLDSAWNHDWLAQAWKTTWVEKAWKSEWLEKAWSNNWLKNSKGGWKEFLDAWVARYVSYDVYTTETKSAYAAIETVKNEKKKQQSGDAVLALAKALTANAADLKDPQVQTNALLSQILIVIEAILQAENTSGGASLATSLSALGLGLVT